MSSRNYSNLLLFSTIFDAIPSSLADVVSFADTVFSPNVPVIESDCKTTLGQYIEVTYDLEGKVELSTGEVISKDRIEQLLSQGIYYTYVRTLSTCISDGGICQKCYHASRQKDPTPTVGGAVRVYPEYVSATDNITVSAGDTQITLSQDPTMYDRAYVYYKGVLFPESSYSISGTVLKFNGSPLTDKGRVTVRFTTIMRSPFLVWLATTYSGALLGIKDLPYEGLPLRKKLIASLIQSNVLDYLAGKVSNYSSIPVETISYLNSIKDPLEKSLLTIALYSIYSNVVS